MQVLLFGRLADVADARILHPVPPPASLEALRDWIRQSHPGLSAALAEPGIQMAVNHVIVREDCPLTANCEVAFMPPMSGG